MAWFKKCPASKDEQCPNPDVSTVILIITDVVTMKFQSAKESGIY
jgi:hypothetical protein